MHAYLSHPDVEVDPHRPVPLWRLSKAGRARVESFARASDRSFSCIFSSDETKAVETAAILAAAWHLPLHINAAMHENDRSATGYFPSDAFESAANAFFAQPDDSYLGWETARAAQARILAEVSRAISQTAHPDILFVGHGGVGTLLYCHLAGRAISRLQNLGHPKGGNLFDWRSGQAPEGYWRAMEDASAAL
ncbi:MAG: histidine phosphatase family protein [Pseudomonadota bacterium]